MYRKKGNAKTYYKTLGIIVALRYWKRSRKISGYSLFYSRISNETFERKMKNEILRWCVFLDIFCKRFSSSDLTQFYRTSSSVYMHWSLLMWRTVARGHVNRLLSPPLPPPPPHTHTHTTRPNGPRPSRQAPVVTEAPWSCLWFTNFPPAFIASILHKVGVKTSAVFLNDC
jgi:hypothetical protein